MTSRSDVDRSFGAVAVVALALSGCSDPGMDPSLESFDELEERWTEPTEGAWAQVTIERQHTLLDADEATRSSEAMAHFVRVSAVRERTPLAGLTDPVPAAGQCRTALERNSESLSALQPLDLLDVESVTLTPRLAPDSLAPDSLARDEGAAVQGLPVALVPHAFPSIQSYAGGVVYTTPDREGTALPDRAEYVVSIVGSQHVESLELFGEAPAELANVSVDGIPLREATALGVGSSPTFTWTPGVPGDLVYLELHEDGSPRLRCSAADEEGKLAVPRELLASLTNDTIVSMHRLRVLEYLPDEPSANAPGALQATVPTHAELRFDFEISRRLAINP